MRRPLCPELAFSLLLGLGQLIVGVRGPFPDDGVGGLQDRPQPPRTAPAHIARQHSVDGRERADNGAVLAVGTDREDDGLGTQVHGFGIAEPRRSAISGGAGGGPAPRRAPAWRSEEHTSELQSLMRNSYAVFCLKKKNKN